MPDPLSTFSAAAAAIQVADFALRLSRQIYVFLHEVRSSSDDIRRLHDVLRETDALMRNIIAYIIEWNNSSRMREEHRYLPPLLSRAVELFAEDVKTLRQHLPEDISPTFFHRTKFAFQKSKLKEITERFLERKGTATLALCIVGRQNDLIALDGLGSLNSSLDSVIASNALATRQRGTVLTTVQGISATQHQARVQINQFQRTSSSQYSDIVSRLEDLTLLTRAQAQAQVQTAYPAYSVTTPNIPDNPGCFSKVLRAELKQALDPVSHKLERFDKIIDDLTREISQSVRESSGAKQRPRESRTAGQRGAPSYVDSSCQTDLDPAPEIDHWKVPCQLGEVCLKTESHLYKSKLGKLVVQWSRLRTRSTDSALIPTSFFRIRITFCPNPRISSHGLSFLWTTGRGYYDICPKLDTFRLLPPDAEVWDVLSEDDVCRFRQILDSGHVNWRDRSIDGDNNIVEFALLEKASNICQLLFRDSGLNMSQIADSSGLDHWYALQFPWRFWDPGIYYRKTFRIYSLIDYYLDLQFARQAWKVSAIIQLTALEASGNAPTDSLCVWMAAVAEKLMGGVPLWPFPWLEESISHSVRDFPYAVDPNRERWFLELFLERGGDPDLRGPTALENALPLETALELTTCCLPSRHPREERFLIDHSCQLPNEYITSSQRSRNDRIPLPFLRWHIVQDLEKSCPDHASLHIAWGEAHNKGHVEHEASVQVELQEHDPLLFLAPLIEAGADVCAIVENRDGKPLYSLTDYAFQLDLGGVWIEALEEYGYDWEEVNLESDRRLENMRRLQNATASGVDTGVLEIQEISGLRYRGRRREEMEMEDTVRGLHVCS